MWAASPALCCCCRLTINYNLLHNEGNHMKKKLLLITGITLLLATASAQANSWSMPNKAGGQIILSDAPCADQANGSGLLEAYAYTPDGTRTAGCWTVIDNLIHIGWGQGRRSVFQQDRFIPEATTSPPARRPAKPL